LQQAAIGNCLSFDPFPFDQNGLAAVVLSLNSSAAFITMKAGLAIRPCAFYSEPYSP
jgi:hypothetical protein